MDAHELLVQVSLLLQLLCGACGSICVCRRCKGFERVPNWKYKWLKIVLVSYYSIIEAITHFNTSKGIQLRKN